MNLNFLIFVNVLSLSLFLRKPLNGKLVLIIDEKTSILARATKWIINRTKSLKLEFNINHTLPITPWKNV